MRRLRRLNVEPELLLSLGSGKFEVIAHPLPEDVRVDSAFYDERRHCFAVIIESAGFTPIREGQEIPDIDPPAIRKLQ